LRAEGCRIFCHQDAHLPWFFGGTRDNRTHYPVDVTGGGRNSPIKPQDVGEQVSRNGDLSHLERDIAPVAHDLRANLDEFLLEVVSDQSLIGSGVASVRRKLPRL
jgi:hypothetical protein